MSRFITVDLSSHTRAREILIIRHYENKLIKIIWGPISTDAANIFAVK